MKVKKAHPIVTIMDKAINLHEEQGFAELAFSEIGDFMVQVDRKDGKEVNDKETNSEDLVFAD